MAGTVCAAALLMVSLFTALLHEDVHRALDRSYLNQVPEDGALFDIIIVGAGSAGSVLASRLSERADLRVLLLEAGGDETPTQDIPGYEFYLLRIRDDIFWQFSSQPTPNACGGEPCSLLRGKGLGGCSAVNFMAYLRGNRRDYDDWEAMGNPGWGYNNALKYFLKSEDQLSPHLAADRQYHSVGGPLGVETASKSNYEIYKIFSDALRQLGFPEVDSNARSQLGVSEPQYTTRKGTRNSAYRAFVEPIRGSRPNLQIMTKAFVTKILFNQNLVAVGVEYEYVGSTRRAIANNEVIVSAGAIQSPQILMLSGIGRKSLLEPLQIRVRKELPVGESLKDHVAIINSGLYFKSDKPLRDLSNPLKTGLQDLEASLHPDNSSGPLTSPPTAVHMFIDLDGDGERPEISIDFLKSFLPEEGCPPEGLVHSGFYNGLSVLVSLTQPKSVGHIRLTDANPHSAPIIYTNYLSDPQDALALRSAFKKMYAIFKASSFQKAGFHLVTVHVPGCENHTFASDQYWDCLIREYSETFNHVSSSCRMGPRNDPTAVVDPELRVYGTQHLRVVDASIMPTTISAAINAATIMIAEHAADLVKKAWPPRPAGGCNHCPK